MQSIYYCSLTNRTGQGCNSKTDGQSRRITGRELIQSILRRRTNPFLPLSFLLASPLLSSTRWLLLQRRGSAGHIHVKGAQLSSNPSEHPRVQNIRTILDSSDLRIKHVNSKMVVFRRYLRIHGLRSTIRAMVQKVKFLVNSGASFYIFLALHSTPLKRIRPRIWPLLRKSQRKLVNMYNKELTSLKKIGVLVAHCRLQFPCSFSLRLITP
jgi:hypothetical protein